MDHQRQLGPLLGVPVYHVEIVVATHPHTQGRYNSTCTQVLPGDFAPFRVCTPLCARKWVASSEGPLCVAIVSQSLCAALCMSSGGECATQSRVADSPAIDTPEPMLTTPPSTLVGDVSSHKTTPLSHHPPLDKSARVQQPTKSLPSPPSLLPGSETPPTTPSVDPVHGALPCPSEPTHALPSAGAMVPGRDERKGALNARVPAANGTATYSHAQRELALVNTPATSVFFAFHYTLSCPTFRPGCWCSSCFDMVQLLLGACSSEHMHLNMLIHIDIRIHMHFAHVLALVRVHARLHAHAWTQTHDLTRLWFFLCDIQTAQWNQ